MPAAASSSANPGPLLVFDFDGVLVDGMAEYWWSARRAAQALAPRCELPETAPNGFRQLRPQIHKGWEMVLVALELSRSELDLNDYLHAYSEHTAAALQRWQQQPAALQQALEEQRHTALRQNREAWLALHRPYPGVPERLRALDAEGSPWLVLTTKGEAFARELLQGYALTPQAVYGHERGSKTEVLQQLLLLQPAEQLRPLWFVEDRRPTLESVRRTPSLNAVRCFLASWGYLNPDDSHQLPSGIHLLSPEQFQRPLARWP